ncbi:MAG: DnaJ domain-containing protein [Spirochaetes bacterium]|nr:DnaJ domain-containing protein [Spirochaetota bacterium]
MSSTYCDDKGNIIDFYEILNVPYKAEKELIRSAFCNLIKIYHPDISGKDTEEDKKKVDLIIRGYKVLIDDALRQDYTKKLLSTRRYDSNGYFYLPKNRIKYSISLKDLVTTRLLSKKVSRTERIRKFGQDVEIFITPKESRQGAIAYIELPSRMTCHVCYGEDRYCNVCNGVGRIPTVSRLEIKIHPDTADGSYIDIDLMNVRPDRFTTFRMKNLRIRITVIGKSKPMH